jgi:uncharacterized membrane protein
MKINERIHELKTKGIRQSYDKASDVEKGTGNKVMHVMIFLIASCLVFTVMRVILGSMNTEGWSVVEVTVMQTLLPLAIAMAAGVAVLTGLNQIGRGEK